MRGNRVLAWAAVSLLLLATMQGCYPMREQDAAAVSGTVIDASTRQPVAGVKVSYNEFPRHFVRTSASGQYNLPALRTWHMVILMPGDRFYQNTLVIDARGYEAAAHKVPLYDENVIFDASLNPKPAAP